MATTCVCKQEASSTRSQARFAKCLAIYSMLCIVVAGTQIIEHGQNS